MDSPGSGFYGHMLDDPDAVRSGTIPGIREPEEDAKTACHDDHFLLPCHLRDPSAFDRGFGAAVDAAG